LSKSGFAVSDEQLLTFPCDLPIKVFGRNQPDFQSIAFSIVKSHVATLEEQHISSQLSKAGRYMSLTINIRAESRAQVDAVYTELSANDAVLMVL
jgi:putative lipoic acid-binding regulatory protein